MRNNSLLAAIRSDAFHQQAAADVLAAVQALHRIRDNVQLTPEARMHYLRCVRKNLAAAEDQVAGLDDEPAPCVAAKMADIAHDHFRSTQEIDA